MECDPNSILKMHSDIRNQERHIYNLIKQGENQRLDFKYEINDVRKIAKSFSAFANTQGGRLLVGVKDNGKIAGVQGTEEAYMAESAAHLFCKPAVSFHLRKWMVEKRCVLEVEIPASQQRPHYAKSETGEWIAYVRVADENIKAGSVLINVWKNHQKDLYFAYSHEVKVLMEYLSEKQGISLSKFVKLAHISWSHAENLLVNLILMKVIEPDISATSVNYRLLKQGV
jgi:predicted HTH transcriptional regulator